MHQFSQWNKLRIFLLLAFVLTAHGLQAQTFPQEEGQKVRYNVQIDMQKAYLSGICVMKQEEGLVKASLVNEFGISAMDFTYNPKKDKVKLVNVLKQLNKWYIKLTLKRDLRELIHVLQQGGTYYENTRRHLTYTFVPTEN